MNDTLLYVEINLIGIVVLLIMLYNVRRSYLDVDNVDRVLFEFMLVVNLLIFVADTAMWVLDGANFFGGRTVLMSVTVVYLVFNPIACLSWTMYGDYMLNRDLSALKKRMFAYLLPTIVISVLVICSTATGWLFYLDSANRYVRGQWSIAVPLISSIYFFMIAIMAFLKIMKSEKSLNRQMYFYIFIFPVIPAIGTVIQMKIYGLPLIWICMMISIFFVYINIQNNQMLIDRLTGIYNRYYFEYKLDAVIRNNAKNKNLYLLMIDFDRFKLVNDKYGHIEGDIALKTVASILNQACRRKGCAARYGGDEFMLMYICEKEDDVKNLIDSINRAVEEKNKKGTSPFKIELSIGHCKFEPAEITDVNGFIKKADEAMYKIKNSKK